MKDEMVQIPRSVYDRLLEHLQAHAPTDSWAKSVLDELQREVKPAYLRGKRVISIGWRD